MEYKVVTKHGLEALEKAVEGFLGRGWVCTGGVAVYRESTLLKFSQALYRK